MAEEKKFPKKTPTAKKRDLQNAKRRAHNRTLKSRVATTIRFFEKTVSEKNVEAAKTQLHQVFALIDKGVNKGLFKLNKAARMKSKCASRIS
ncbi:MAG: 30S ribosomal protein S20 [Chlamydiae bacterium]|nr:30S ribosomal protein S20 [Chlamydiota bacterium]